MFYIYSAVLYLILLPYFWTAVLCEISSAPEAKVSVDTDLLPQGFERIRRVRVNETIHDAGSDLLFSWDECVFCSGYRATLQLSHASGNRVLAYPLRFGVTSMRVRDIKQRTTYRLVVEAISSDSKTHLEIEGRTCTSGRPPPPVSNLVVRSINNNSLYAEWSSSVADGFVLKVLNNAELIQEKIIPFTSGKTQLRVDGLQPATQYSIHVIAFYQPNVETKTLAPAVAAQAKTLPTNLPAIRLRFEEYRVGGINLIWRNPTWPRPLSHNLICFKKNETDLDFNEVWIDVQLEGSSESLALSPNMIFKFSDTSCMLRTSFSTDFFASTTISRVFIPNLQHQSFWDRDHSVLNCSKAKGPHSPAVTLLQIREFTFSASVIDKKNVRGFKSDTIYVQFDASGKDTDVVNITHQYSLCKNNESCSNWKNVPSDKPIGIPPTDGSLPSYEIRLIPEDMYPWEPYILYHRIVIRCINDGMQKLYSSSKSLVLPEVTGKVPAVSTIKVSKNGTRVKLTWLYEGSVLPDFFLLTRCIREPQREGSGSACSAESIPRDTNVADLDSLEKGRVAFITLQVGKVNRVTGETIVSEPLVRSFYASDQRQILGNINFSIKEITNSSDVRLLITHNTTNDHLPNVMEFHVTVCGKLLPLWEGDAIGRLIEASKTCEKFITSLTNATLTLKRRPWTEYRIRVDEQNGTFNSTEHSPLANTTLPVFKPAPGPIVDLSWEEGSFLLSWLYNSSWSPSGFLVTFCADHGYAPEKCTSIKTGPTDRRYHVNLKDIPGTRVIASVSSFVSFEGSYLLGPQSELVVSKLTATSTESD